jgi:hypothetical protein
VYLNAISVIVSLCFFSEGTGFGVFTQRKRTFSYVPLYLMRMVSPSTTRTTLYWPAKTTPGMMIEKRINIGKSFNFIPLDVSFFAQNMITLKSRTKSLKRFK